MAAHSSTLSNSKNAGRLAHFRWLWRFIRAHEWWHYKLPVALGITYLFAWTQGLSFGLLLLPSLLIIAAGFGLAIYASIFNDFMDLKQDQLAGKYTPMMSLTPTSRFCALALNVTLLASIAYALRNLPFSFALFMLIWTAYTAYSLPPIRLKERGILGVLCIGTGEHLLAALLAVAMVSEITGSPVSLGWVATVLAWALAFGCRGIIWHQLCDIENDRRSGCTTLGAMIGRSALTKLAERVIFPVEVVFFGILIVGSHNWLVLAMLPVYGFCEWLRHRFMNTNLIIVAPKPNARFVLFEFYQVFLPLAVLFSACTKDSSAVFVTGTFCLLFAAPIASLVQHLSHMARWRLLPAIAFAQGDRTERLVAGAGKTDDLPSALELGRK